MTPMLLMVSSVAMGGYGDAVDSHPTHAEREVHLWTNAARLDPEAFNGDYAMGGCTSSQFSSDERVPKAPLMWHLDLNEAARYHSNDMDTHNFFDHDSWDGTDFGERVSGFYSGWSMIAENIAMGYPTPRSAVLTGWMCSSGHRANIMNGSLNEHGAGVVGVYYTQDFGTRSAAPDRPVAMGLHLPENPTGGVEIYADWHDDEAPLAMLAVVDGIAYEMDLVYGVDELGMYRVELETDSSCHEYFIAGVRQDDTVYRYPENGSYGWGSCSFDDAMADWFSDQADWAFGEEPGDGGGGGNGGNGNGGGPGGGDGGSDDFEDPFADGADDEADFTIGERGGCSHAGGVAGGAWLGLWALGLVARRRRS